MIRYILLYLTILLVINGNIATANNHHIQGIDTEIKITNDVETARKIAVIQNLDKAYQISTKKHDAEIEKEFCKLAYNGDLNALKEYVSKKNPPINSRDGGMGGTALHAAMFQSNLDVVQFLISYGLDLNAQGYSNGFTPLHDAIWANNIPAVKLLLQSGANPKIKNKNGQTPYDKALSEGKTSIVMILKEAVNQ